MKKISKIIKRTVSVLIILLFFGACDIYSGGEKTITEPDKSVCALLSDSVFVNITSGTPADINKAWTDTALADIAASFLDSLVVDSLFMEQGNTTAYKVTLSADTSFIAVKLKGGKITLYGTNQVSWSILDSGLQPFTLENDLMPGTTVAGCTELDEDEKSQPVIRMREEYTIPAGTYLMRIIKNDQTKGGTFRSVIN